MGTKDSEGGPTGSVEFEKSLSQVSEMLALQTLFAVLGAENLFSNPLRAQAVFDGFMEEHFRLLGKDETTQEDPSDKYNVQM